MNANLQNCLEPHNRVKNKKRRKDLSKEGKSAKSRLEYVKRNKAHREYLDQSTTGLAYRRGIAINTAKREAKNLLNDGYCTTNRTVPKEQWRCRIYHNDYCQKLGHKSATRSKECFANGVSVGGRKE